mmetsp:Transcript_27339/g.82017  ORF Transcript_27339/g.82017 Transcript_27339/m.82017 type:complete len:201 (-) Transcript_27339:40-642(-)|eukprot:CAMPEP_0119261464 /NCGR_PEP_ID=MMETSP1329-20130426/1525_1 /TAXON_ID=114041 /ORGANISM="Genus nov. species nov., Strain RCC1024" /LENGTH=200 /DNA_ID=CAMNT_0007261029 /DNA_START=81 /DNA_END=683 /DNA_ORIENTATION=-
MFLDSVLIDGRTHMLGRLASIVAKELLCGQKIVVVRCEQIVVSGSLMRNKVKFTQFLRKRTNTNPKKGPIHFRSPARMFWRTVRGMLPHKTTRGQEALGRLQCFEGVPAPYDTQKKMVVPAALKAVRLKPGRNSTGLARLATEFGWKHEALVAKMEEKRKVRSAEHYAAKKEAAKALAKATAAAATDTATVDKALAAFGH